MEMAFSRKLKAIIPRLELLGYTLELAKQTYEALCLEWQEDSGAICDQKESPPPITLPFDEFHAFLNRHPVSELDATFTDDEERVKGRFAKDSALLKRIPRDIDYDDLAWSERSYFGSQVNILHPYLMLRLLARNTENLETPVVWQYGPLVENGWAIESEFNPSARRNNTFLIATEGSSDVHILKKAFSLLRPEIADFFRFIDVSESHPFSGTGSLAKFAEGLAKIDVQNNTVFVFDNDAEGLAALEKLAALNMPQNLRAILLPSVEDFESFPCKGPEGEHTADINGRAAAIECYLDLRFKNCPTPRVTWTNYKKDLDIYQGALEQKEKYAKAFMNLSATDFPTGNYQTRNLMKVLDTIISECINIATNVINVQTQ